MTKPFREEQEQMLKDMKERKRVLGVAIARLEDDLEQPPYVSNVDFKEIEKQAEEYTELLDKWEKERNDTKTI